MCSFLCRSLHRSIRPHKHFISANMAHTGLLIHTDIFKFTQGSLLSVRHWETTHPPSPHRAHIQRLLTLTANSGFTPVHNNIWRLLDSPAYARVTPVCKDIWRLLTFPGNSGLTPVHKEIWRLLDFSVHTGFTLVHKEMWNSARENVKCNIFVLIL